jgi:hypothetical protein
LLVNSGSITSVLLNNQTLLLKIIPIQPHHLHYTLDTNSNSIFDHQPRKLCAIDENHL